MFYRIRSMNWPWMQPLKQCIGVGRRLVCWTLEQVLGCYPWWLHDQELMSSLLARFIQLSSLLLCAIFCCIGLKQSGKTAQFWFPLFPLDYTFCLMQVIVLTFHYVASWSTCFLWIATHCAPFINWFFLDFFNSISEYTLHWMNECGKLLRNFDCLICEVLY